MTHRNTQAMQLISLAKRGVKREKRKKRTKEKYFSSLCTIIWIVNFLESFELSENKSLRSTLILPQLVTSDFCIFLDSESD